MCNAPRSIVMATADPAWGSAMAAAAGGFGLAAGTTLRMESKRRTLHRIVYSAHCKHCNSADCLQYENCRHESRSHSQRSADATQRQPGSTTVSDIRNEHSYAALNKPVWSPNEWIDCDAASKHCFSAYCLSADATETHDASFAAAKLDALRRGRRVVGEAHEEETEENDARSGVLSLPLGV